MTRILKAVCCIRFDAFPFFTPLLPIIALSSANYISSNCSAVAPANLTGTTYHRNLKALFVSLIENGPLTGFFSQTVGQSPDQVYGGSDVPRGLPWRPLKTAVIWLDYCQLRYSDVSLQGAVDVSDKACQ
ncbi:hypothetical protein EJ110_NYTH40137 [Nymphaea thermarum]|nr:hypothetical protein EJ110_NYTH40137 [Nymphaea thermarum]